MRHLRGVKVNGDHGDDSEENEFDDLGRNHMGANVPPLLNDVNEIHESEDN
jgi:hypothetical protein